MAYGTMPAPPLNILLRLKYVFVFISSLLYLSGYTVMLVSTGYIVYLSNTAF